MLQHIPARTVHARRGALKNRFGYSVDYVLTDLGETPPWPISRNRFNLWSLHDRDHGGPRGAGVGLSWFRDLLRQHGFDPAGARLLLLTQPRYLWFHFNPVSFWIAEDAQGPRAFVAEVNSTFGQRHCYFCAHDDFRPIAPGDVLTARKLMHVSPFQSVSGEYRFNLSLTSQRVDIRIDYRNGDQGVVATLGGPRRAATATGLMAAALRRPLGALRVLALIHWQAVILAIKRAPFLGRQPAPATLLSSGNETPGPRP